MDEDEKILDAAIADASAEDESREDSLDPDVRNGGPFGGDESEGEAWIKAFTESSTPKQGE